ncbi:MAG: Fe-S cluster assembly protein SufD [Micrococcales bacterium 73-13]|nr:MAG: Fe-S cluster assembly protein SufD [Micrococcales bacterium 73-13]
MEPHSHGGDAAGWITPVQTRDERPWSYDPADFGAPVRTDPAWRYSDLDRLAPLFDASGVTGATVADGDFRPEDLVSAIALQRAVPRRLVADGRLDVEVRADGDAVRAEHLVIEAPEQAVATVVIEHAGAGALAENVEILVRPGAELTLVTLQLWDDGAVHSASHQAVVQRGATLKHVVVTLGGAAVRVNPSIRLEGDGAQAQLLGLAFADAGQHFESQVFLHHVGRHTRGNVTYKGALQGASARTVWIGDVLIGPDATGTDTYEQNRNLVLTEGARADSIPNLEIETGEIEGAGHASATGRFDDEQLFYLRARGIPEAEARRLVVLGFLAEVIQQIPDAALQERLTAAVERELGR